MLLAMLSRRERRKVIASMLPWRAVLALPRPKARRNPLDLEILFILIAASFTILSLLGPELSSVAKTPDAIVVIIDSSASMNAVNSAGTSRLAQAAEWIPKICAVNKIEKVHLYDSASPIPLGNDLSPEDAARKTSALRIFPKGGVSGDISTRAILAANRQEHRPTVWIGDRPSPIDSPALHQIIVGESTTNAAIISAKVIDHEKLFIVTGNYSNSANKLILSITDQNDIVFELSPMQIKAHALTLPQKLAGKITVILKADIDALSADNRVTINNENITASVDEQENRHAALALREAAGCTIVSPDSVEAADISITKNSGGTLPKAGIIMLSPEKAGAGLVDISGSEKVLAVRITRDGAWLPEICASGWGNFSLPRSVLPVDAKILLEAITDAGKLPLVASWNWKGKTVFYVASTPEQWKKHPSFAVLLAELSEKITGEKDRLPGADESDIRMTVPATAVTPKINQHEIKRSQLNLSRIMLALSACACGVLFLRERKRAK